MSERKRERANVTAAPRSACLLTGVARIVWAHSIAPGDALRHSVAFGYLREA